MSALQYQAGIGPAASPRLSVEASRGRQRWPLRATLMLAGGTSLLLWGALATATGWLLSAL